KIQESAEYKAMTEKQREEKEKALDAEIEKVNVAFSVLGNEGKKAEYDSGKGQYGGFDMGGFDGFADIFSQFTGQGGRRRQQPKVKDTVTNIKISIKDVFTGKTNKYRVNVKKLCKTCGGKGCDEVTVCSQCKGSGSVMARISSHMNICTEVKCPGCKGKGEISKGPMCVSCHGEKVTQESDVVEVNIPKGVRDQECVSFPGKGHQYPGYQSGDLLFKICIEGDNRYIRHGDNLISDIDIDLLSALSGGCIAYEHPDGRKINVNFKAFDNFEDSIIVRNEGFPGERGKGDLCIKPRILINKGLSRNQLESVIKPLVPVPSGQCSTSVNGCFGKIARQEPERDEREGQYGFEAGDFFKSFSFF
ncbi:DnaJ-like protein subfamily A member 2, partial [Enteropsectra breve]